MDNIIVKKKNTTNTNDPISKKAVACTFYIGNEKLGTANVSSVDTNNGFLYEVEVVKKYRGKGYGNWIINYMMKNYRINELTVEKSNRVAINLYKKFGFKTQFEFEENGKRMIDMKINKNISESNLIFGVVELI